MTYKVDAKCNELVVISHALLGLNFRNEGLSKPNLYQSIEYINAIMPQFNIIQIETLHQIHGFHSLQNGSKI